MCYFVEHNIQRKELEKRFNVKFPEDPRYMPSFFSSAFNKPFLPVITAEKPDSIQLFQWGLIPYWAQNREVAEKTSLMTFNARSESVWEKATFKKPILKGRCLVPAHGFFEYHTAGKLKIPYYIHLKDDSVFAFAGIYDSWSDRETGEIHQTFSILTTQANPMMEQVHNLKKRMPLILSKANEDVWLNPHSAQDTISGLFKPYPEEEMEAYTVSKKISARDIDPTDNTLIKKYEFSNTSTLF